jgi:hypothetical protein
MPLVPICGYCDETIDRDEDNGDDYVITHRVEYRAGALDVEQSTFAHAACYEADRGAKVKAS